MENAWALIEQGKFTEACKKAREEYEETKSTSALYHQGLSLLLLKDY